LQSWYDTATAEIAADRKLDRAAIVDILDNAPLQVEEIRGRGIITDIGYDDDARDSARRRAGSGVTVTRFDRYAQAMRNQRTPQGAPVIAFVHAAGEIVEDSDDNPLGQNGAQISGDTFARAFRTLAADSTVKAVVLRIDSPGGSAIASDQIL